MTDQNGSNEQLESTSKKKGMNKFLLAFVIFSGICLLSLIAGFIYREINVAPLREADALIKQGKCADAMPILNKLIEERPGWTLPYERRIECNLTFQSNVFTVAQGYLLAALQDDETIIKLQPSGGYYAERDQILRRMADLEVNSADKFAIFDLANQDVSKAIQLGVDPSSYVYRHYARNLIEGNHCETGLVATQKLIDQGTVNSSDFGQYYSVYLTEAYLCLGKLDKALESAQRITCDDPVSTCRSGLLAEVYFQSGDYKNALGTINYMINSHPMGAGQRYYIRALVYYEQGQKDLVLHDLELGDSYMWFKNGVSWYVRAKLAFDAGDEESGITDLQRAEQTLDVTYMPLRKEVIEELAAHGAQPIALVPDLPFTITPTP